MQNRGKTSTTTKRLLDIVISGCGLIVALPLILLAGLTVRISMGSPVIYRSKRAGITGSPFMLLKLRTMRSTVDSRGNLLPDELRVSRIGRFLRRSSIDELPQLINILKGDMSLVGPRPLPLEYNAHYNARQSKRLTVKPGLTGWSQVHYRKNRTWEEKIENDIHYVEQQSLLLDIQIIAMTFSSLVKRFFYNPKGSSTSAPFIAPKNTDE